MKRILLFFLALILFLPSCGGQNKMVNAGTVAQNVKENKNLFLQCYEILSEMKKERVYVAMEEEKDEDKNEIEGSKRLVLYEKESDERTEIENEILEKALTDFGLALIFYQTASDGRVCVIFSYTKENEKGKVQNGFYYSPDTQPCAWWGRRGELIRRDDRYLQLNRKEDAVYYTVNIENSFYYFEKYGDLLA